MKGLRSSLPGLTPQVGFTRLAALHGADLGYSRGPMQSIHLRKDLLTKMMDWRVRPAHDGLKNRLNPTPWRGLLVVILLFAACPAAAQDYPTRPVRAIVAVGAGGTG